MFRPENDKICKTLEKLSSSVVGNVQENTVDYHAPKSDYREQMSTSSRGSQGPTALFPVKTLPKRPVSTFQKVTLQPKRLKINHTPIISENNVQEFFDMNMVKDEPSEDSYQRSEKTVSIYSEEDDDEELLELQHEIDVLQNTLREKLDYLAKRRAEKRSEKEEHSRNKMTIQSIVTLSTHPIVSAESMSLKEFHDTGFSRDSDQLDMIAQLRESQIFPVVDLGTDGLTQTQSIEAMQAMMYLNMRIGQQTSTSSVSRVNESQATINCELSSYQPRGDLIDLKKPKIINFNSNVLNISQLFYDIVITTPMNHKFWNIAISEMVTKVLGDQNALKTFFLMSRSNRPTELFKAIQSVFAESCGIDMAHRPAFNGILAKRFPHYLQLHRRNTTNRQDRHANNIYSPNMDMSLDNSPDIKIEEADF